METENRGKAYERAMISKYSFLNASSTSKIDMYFNIKGKRINFELKSDVSGRIDYGQSAIRFNSNDEWEFTEKRTKWSKELKDILISAGVLNIINSHWKNEGYNKTEEAEIKRKYASNPERKKQELKKIADWTRENMTPTINVLVDEQDDIFSRVSNYDYKKIDEQIYMNINQDVLKTAISKYYASRGCDYINIQNKGLYKVSDNDPLNEISKGQISVPLFLPTQVGFIARLKGSGSSRGYVYTTSLTLPTGFSVGVEKINQTLLGQSRSGFITIGLDDNNFQDYLKVLNNSQ